VGFEILTAVATKDSIFRDIMLCSLTKVNHRFGNYHQEGSKQSSSACYLFHACFLLCILFDPEDGGDIFLQNVCGLSLDDTALNPRRKNSSKSKVTLLSHSG
jgi:hypothetical protein